MVIFFYVMTGFPSSNPSGLPTTSPSKIPTRIPTTVPTTIPTTIPSTIPTRTPSQMPSQIPTKMPSKTPSSTPSSVPSSIPSSTPSRAPTNNPTYTPTVYPSFMPIAIGGGTQLSEFNEEILSTIDDVVGFIGLVLITIIFMLLIIRLTRKCFSKCVGGDEFEYGYIIRYIHSVSDFWTDLLFVYSMYLHKQYILCLCSAFFTIVPFLASLAFIIYWMFTWRVMTATASLRLRQYLQKHSILLIVLTMTAGFHSCVLLLQSKLFYVDVFHFPLKQSEMSNLLWHNFIAKTLLEVSSMCIYLLPHSVLYLLFLFSVFCLSTLCGIYAVVFLH